MLVTGYALAVAAGSPILAIATAKLPRRATLIGLMGLFILGTLTNQTPIKPCVLDAPLVIRRSAGPLRAAPTRRKSRIPEKV